jgi:hypothetical protein
MADDVKKPLVFISHKHQDVDIAKALASWLQVATRNGVEVFQSSDGFKDGPSLGRSLTEEFAAERTKRQRCSSCTPTLSRIGNG